MRPADRVRADQVEQAEPRSEIMVRFMDDSAEQRMHVRR